MKTGRCVVRGVVSASCPWGQRLAWPVSQFQPWLMHSLCWTGIFGVPMLLLIVSILKRTFLSRALPTPSTNCGRKFSKHRNAHREPGNLQPHRLDNHYWCRSPFPQAHGFQSCLLGAWCFPQCLCKPTQFNVPRTASLWTHWIRTAGSGRLLPKC